MDRQFLYIFLNIYKCIMANTSASGSKLHIPPTNYHLRGAQQETYKKA